MADDELEKLEMSLVEVSDLYNNYASRFSMSELCLSILQACEEPHTEAIERNWKNIICNEFLPCGTRSEIAHSYLQKLVSDNDISYSITFLDGRSPSNFLLFESGDWAKGLETKLVEVGRDLYSPGSEYIFPVDFLLDILEGKLFVKSRGP